ncbi:NAD(+) diphosphatase, partial [Klebsiella quasipneumoniae]
MDRIIEKLDRGWWVVSHEQKLWLPGGELPHGEAVNFDLVGQHALHIGEWQGDPVWMVRQDRRHDMGSLRQVLDQDPGLFQL